GGQHLRSVHRTTVEGGPVSGQCGFDATGDVGLGGRGRARDRRRDQRGGGQYPADERSASGARSSRGTAGSSRSHRQHSFVISAFQTKNYCCRTGTGGGQPFPLRSSQIAPWVIFT